MTIDWIRKYCRSLSGATEQIQWEHDLVFKVGGKMFAVMPLEPGALSLSFKCTPEHFADLTERPDVRPAAYLARAHWISLETENALPRLEVEKLILESYQLVTARLSKKAQALLSIPKKTKVRKRARKS